MILSLSFSFITKFKHKNVDARFKVIKVLYNELSNNVNEENNLKASSKVLSGLCAVYKPKGITSSGVVGRIKFILQSGAQKIVGNKVKIKVLKPLL